MPDRKEICQIQLKTVERLRQPGVLLSDVWDFAKCIIFACFQRCHRSKWHVFENADLWRFLARAGWPFIGGLGRLDTRAPFRVQMMQWFFQPLARVPTEVQANQAG